MNDHEFSARLIAMTDTLYRVCYAQLYNERDREDAVQECLCKAWQNRGKLREGRYLQTWVCRILLNECHNIQRRNNRLANSLDYQGEPTAFTPPPAPPDAIPELHDALLRLPEEQRLPIVLHYLEGFSVAEVARILDIPVGTVKSRMHHARVGLGALLADSEPGTEPTPPPGVYRVSGAASSSMTSSGGAPSGGAPSSATPSGATPSGAALL